MDLLPEPLRRWASCLLTLFIGGATLAFVSCVGIGVFFLTRPRGEAIGEASLLDPSAAVAADLKPGDTLFFRVDAAVGLPAISLMSDDQEERLIDKQLRGSSLTVRATSPAGAERTATCPVYNGRAISTTTTPGRLSRSGMLNACQVPIDAAGRWTIRGSVAWSPELEVKSATLEVRREAAEQGG